MGTDQRKLAGDHKNATYDSDKDGQVDDADTVDGKHASELGSARTIEKDGTIDVSDVGSHIYNLDKTDADFILVDYNIKMTNGGGNGNVSLTLRLNGDTGNNYDLHNFDGSSSLGDNKLKALTYLESVGEGGKGMLHLSASWDSHCTVHSVLPPKVQGTGMNAGHNDSITSPLSSIEFFDPHNGDRFDLKATIYRGYL